MYTRKPLQKLRLKDNFMFCAVMSDPDNCKPFLERVLGKTIGRLVVDKEKCLIYNPRYKSVRLDVYARDDDNVHYNVEMQVVKPADLLKRSRYYHSQIDMELLAAGTEYEKLPECFVIFVCDFDPFGYGKYCYFMQPYCKETGEPVNTGSFTIFLSTCGKNRDEVPKELADLLEYIHFEETRALQENEDAYIRQLQDSIARIKNSREMGGRYMLFSEMLKEERNEGRRETQKKYILELISSKGVLSDALRQRIEAEEDTDILEMWFREALCAATVEEIEEIVDN